MRDPCAPRTDNISLDFMRLLHTDTSHACTLLLLLLHNVCVTCPFLLLSGI